MMKKLISLSLVLVMCLSLIVTANAAGYAPYTFAADDGAVLTFDAAKVVKETHTFGDPDGTYEKEVTIIYLKPGSNISVEHDYPYGYGANGDELGEDGIYWMSPAWFDIHNGAVEKSLRSGILLELDWENNVYLALGEDSAELISPPIAPPDTAIENLAYASTQVVGLNGSPVTLEAYALKDENGNDTNYVKLRDIASLLNGTASQFEVGWDGNVNIITDSAYTANGTEMNTPFSGNREYTVPTSVTKVNGEVKDLSAICLTDDQGGGYTYYKLRDLGKFIGFNVSWSAETGILIEPGVPYTDAN